MKLTTSYLSVTLLVITILVYCVPLTQSKRLIECSGTIHSCGIKIGKETKHDIQTLFSLKTELWKKNIDYWKKLAQSSEKPIQRYAPTTYEEMKGIAEGSGVGMQTLLMLATEYEMFMKFNSTANAEKCTGFSTRGTTIGTGPVISGQNNDEPPSSWYGGKYDIVVKLHYPHLNQSTIFYTHPGYPAYMGMNSNGLSLLWQYIDNGERNILNGVPTCAMLREIISKQTLYNAVSFVDAIPHTVPNNLMITYPKEGLVNIELSPTHFTPLYVYRGDLCHTNHILFDEEMQDNDIGKPNAPTSVIRYKKIRELMKANRGQMSASIGTHMLSQSPVYNPRTLASMVFDADHLEMRIRFKGDVSYTSYKL